MGLPPFFYLTSDVVFCIFLIGDFRLFQFFTTLASLYDWQFSVLLQPRGIISPSRFQEAGTSLVFGARPWALVSGSVVTFLHPHTSQRHGRGHPPPFRPSRPLFVYCHSSFFFCKLLPEKTIGCVLLDGFLWKKFALSIFANLVWILGSIPTVGKIPSPLIRVNYLDK